MKKATPKLPAHWRRNAVQPGGVGRPAPHHDDREAVLEELDGLVPGIRKAVMSGWEIVAYVSTITTMPNAWGGGKARFLLSFFGNGMLLRCRDYDRIEHAIQDAEMIGRHAPGMYLVVGEAEQPIAEFGLTSAADLLDEDPPVREWHVPGIVPAGLPTLLFGDGGTGKSLVSLQLAVATAAGRPWLGHAVRQGPAIFMSAEDDEGEVHRRLADIAAHEGLGRRDFADLNVNARVGEDALLGIYNPDTRMIEPTALYGALERAVERQRPALLVLDTLADLFGGDENVRSQARQFVGLLRRLSNPCGTAVVCLAHPSVAGMNSGVGSSGSTGWGNSVRSRLYLEREFQMRGKAEARRMVEPDRAVRILTTKKLNAGEAGGAQRLRWRDGVLVKDEVLLLSTPTAIADQAARETTAAVDELFLTLLAAFTIEGRNAGPSPSSSYAPTLFAKDERAGKVSKAAFAKSMGRLLADGRVVIEQYGAPNRGTKRLAIAAHPPADAFAD